MHHAISDIGCDFPRMRVAFRMNTKTPFENYYRDLKNPIANTEQLTETSFTPSPWDENGFDMIVLR